MMKQKATISFCDRDFAIDDLTADEWQKAEPVAIASYWNGEPAPEGRTASARLLWSNAALYVRFDCRQDEPLFLNENPQTAAKTMQLWEHDVCELFLAPNRDEPRRYAEFEIAPTGEWLDLFVDWTKDEPRDWAYHSGMTATARIADDLVVMVMQIPWTAFDRRPEPGEVWLGNMFRQVGSGDTRGYLAWSPTMTDEPQFHVPERFGEFVFVK
jgi:hypothetical protein